ncbi:MAG: ribonuclease H, mammalian HI/archaeal HII subfamily [Promethearchaeota archaeon CR_4]|nr:MAG: ribonuclease H, mammalian HI/archaeal HII subfamily [Candidatus Lokiarchaeota archaeon CR_4]
MKIIGGIDEAGRGPVFGPMIVCGLTILEEKYFILKEMGVKDSKLLTPRNREKLAPQIQKVVEKLVIRELSPEKIDDLRAKGVSMNEIEVQIMAEILTELKPDVVYIDAVDVKEERFGQNIKRLAGLKNVEIIAEHKADFTYPIVGAASIIAKTRRDAEIAKIQTKYGEIGSGYPSDPVTIKFLENWVQNHKNLPPFARKSWKTSQNILNNSVRQRKITDF